MPTPVEDPKFNFPFETVKPSPIAKAVEDAYRKQNPDADPSRELPGMPPNFGEPVLPHVTTFQSIVSAASRVYRPSDEALRDSKENARFMRNDPTIMECVEQRQRSVALLDWHIEPDNEQDNTQKWLADELTSILNASPRFMQYRENLLHAIWFGRYAIAHRWRWKKIRGKMRVVLENWMPLHGDKLAYRYDQTTGDWNRTDIGIRVGAGFNIGDFVNHKWRVEKSHKVEATDLGLAYFLRPWERSLLAIHRHYVEDGEYEDPFSAGRVFGVGIRSRIYWCWYQKQEALAFLMEFLERSATGMEIWYYPWGSQEARDQTRKAAEERIGAGGNIVLVPRPIDGEMAYGVDRIEPSMGGADSLERIITEYFGHLIKRYILGQTLTSEAQSTGLGSGLAEVHLDTYMQIIKYDSTNLEETMTTDLLEPLLKYNFPQYADLPLKFRIDTEAPDVDGKLAAWEKAFNMGLELKSQDVMDLIGATKPLPSDDTLKNPQMDPEAMGGMGGMGGGMPGMEGGMPGGGMPGGEMPGGEMPPEGPAGQPPEPPPNATGINEDPFSDEIFEETDPVAEQQEQENVNDVMRELSKNGQIDPIKGEDSEREKVKLSRMQEAERLGFIGTGARIDSINADLYVLQYAKDRGFIPTGDSHQENIISALAYAGVERYQQSKWISFQGPQGGKGWQNTQSGEILYQDEKPDEGQAAEEQPGQPGQPGQPEQPEQEDPNFEKGSYNEKGFYEPSQDEIKRDMGSLGGKDVPEAGKNIYEIADSLNIKRGAMPQVTKENFGEFLDFLQRGGISVQEGSIPAKELKGTQQEINGGKVASMAEFLRTGGEFPATDAVLASSDGHILDGHHRGAAYRLATPDDSIDVVKVDMPIKQLLHHTQQFDKVGFAGVGKSEQGPEGGPVETPKPKPSEAKSESKGFESSLQQNYNPNNPQHVQAVQAMGLSANPGEASRQISSLVGAPDDADVSWQIVSGMKGINLSATATGPDGSYRTQRYLGVDSDGNKFISNVSMNVRRDLQGQGIGSTMLAKQAATAREQGISYIETEAIAEEADDQRRESSNRLNTSGYVVWAKLGYNAQLTPHQKEKIASDGICCPESIQDLMSEYGGEDAWRKHGYTFKGRFDLSAESLSSRVLDKYMQKKRALGQVPEIYQQELRGPEMAQPKGENHDLSEVELDLLDQVWKEIQAENNPPQEQFSLTGPKQPRTVEDVLRFARDTQTLGQLLDNGVEAEVIEQATERYHAASWLPDIGITKEPWEVTQADLDRLNEERPWEK